MLLALFVQNVISKVTIGKEINGNMNVRDAVNERHYEVVLQCMDHAYPLDIGLSQFIY